MRIRKPLYLLFMGFILSLTLVFASGCTIVLPEGFEDILGGGSQSDTDNNEDDSNVDDDSEDDNDAPCTHEWLDATCKAPKTCALCSATEGVRAEHTPEEDDGDCTTAVHCSVCQAVVIAANRTHMGGRPTCTTLAECSVCGLEYGELAVHAESVIWIKRLDAHYQAYACCLERVSEDEAHTYGCEVCGFSPAIGADAVSGTAGETVTLSLSIEDNPGICGLEIEIIFNDTALTLTAAEAGEALSALDFTPDDNLVSGAVLLFDATAVADEDIMDGEMLSLTFTISENATAGDYIIQLNITAYANIKTDDGDYNLKPVDFAVGGVKISVEND